MLISRDDMVDLNDMSPISTVHPLVPIAHDPLSVVLLILSFVPIQLVFWARYVLTLAPSAMPIFPEIEKG